MILTALYFLYENSYTTQNSNKGIARSLDAISMASSAYDVNYYMGSDATIVPTTPLLTQMVNLTQSTITATTDTTSSDQVKRKVMRFLTEETSLVWIIFGTIGNLLTLLVLCKPRMRKHSTFTYLTILSLCDTFVLYFGLFRDYLVYKYKYDIDGDFICKFHVFFFYFVLHMASWLLVAVNIDRLIAATFLGKSKFPVLFRTNFGVPIKILI